MTNQLRTGGIRIGIKIVRNKSTRKPTECKYICCEITLLPASLPMTTKTSFDLHLLSGFPSNPGCCYCYRVVVFVLSSIICFHSFGSLLICLSLSDAFG